MQHNNPLLRNIKSPQKFITIGEIMLRLTPPNYEKIRMANSFEANYGGSEANIALALANDATIRQSIMNKLQWPNVLPEDIDNYCVKNALFPIEAEGYFVNITDMKELFKSLTNKELTYDSKITSNKYYKYGAYLETESLRLTDNIKEISKVTSVKKKVLVSSGIVCDNSSICSFESCDK